MQREGLDTRMSKIAIVTDSNSGITQAEGARRGIHVLPMPFMIDEVTYYEDIDLTQEQFYEKLKSGANIATSQPSPDSVTSLWDKLLQEYDEIVHIPMSSGLSGSCQSAMAFAADYDGRVQVVNNQRISVTQRQSALDALQLAAACYSNIPCIFCVKQTPPKLAGRAQTLAWRVQRILAVILRADQFRLRIKEECCIRVDAQRTGKECSVRQIHSPAHARSVIQRPLDRFRVECPPIACRAVWCLRYIIELSRRQQMS